MEIFRTEDFYIFVKESLSLWWDRHTGSFIPKTGWDLTDADDPVCLGVCYGIIGIVDHPSVFDTRLLLIRESASVGYLHGNHEVFKIKSIAFLKLDGECDMQLQPCPKHKAMVRYKRGRDNPIFDIQRTVSLTSKTLGTLKSAGNVIKTTTQQAAAMATGTPIRRDKERFEKSIIEEFHRIFTDTNSFYYSYTCDITSSLQRLCNLERKGVIDANALWKTVNDKFFWNKHMLKVLIESNNPLCDPWILPIIQGYIQIEDCKVEIENDLRSVKDEPHYEVFKLCILSRRSRFRAGTRYKRRGVDENGECANYVETEQIIQYHHHEVSFVQVRGSVPVYWSQPGYKYRPPPRIDKGETETKIAFEKHFIKEIRTYGPICIINLIDQSGKEKVIWDAYSHHIFQYNSQHITYVTFDFHEYCRGMHFENVSLLINSIADIIKDMNYCWRDRQGHICSQVGVFRTNCIDCLDRTNVVQTALGKAIMEIQFCKLGLISPEGNIPDTIKHTFQLLWANNGDTISKQYAGTNALKGDYTRTGERKLAGIMKDGMNSANRYYKSHFTDALRQCCLDLMHGNTVTESDVQDSWSHLNTIGNIANELVPLARPAYVPHIALAQEFELANAMYYMFRYYLSRFKDSARQGTIDLMLGNTVELETFSDAKPGPYDEDSGATAERVKWLIEDCKKMLINNPELVLGSWGLINADPSTGDPNEAEMDTILILTRDSYFVADYDDQVDKVTKYQRVSLGDVTLLESGVPETIASLFKCSRNHYCIRINYKVNNVGGYYHMFRSTNLRFFNNMTVVIKNEEEEIESLKSICEAFTVALDIAGLPPVKYHQGHRLDKRKSKVLTDNKSTGMYLDLVGLPQLTRNVSETQLLALKNAGTKALSNVTQQFSKLNKFSPRFKSKSKQAKFSIGFSKGNNYSSSDSEEEYESNIFQPHSSIESGTSLRFDSNSSLGDKASADIEQGIEITENSKFADNLANERSETFLPSVGIVMGASNEPPITKNILEKKDSLNSNEHSSQVNNVQLSSIMDSVSIQKDPPEIQVSEEPQNLDKRQPPTTLKLDRKLSHSSGEVDVGTTDQIREDDTEPSSIYVAGEARFDKRSNSEQDVILNICQSQSESALKSKLTNLTSPVATVTKGLVSPLSKLAKGVQNLGANLDPRKIAGGVRQVSEKEMEEHRKMEEKWRNCKTRLIAL
ncbi:hypothetical protein Trydic_g3667 [Trypoxylus dichotomus]